jgi:hypothetical protein
MNTSHVFYGPSVTAGKAVKRYGCLGKQLRAVHHSLTQIGHSVTGLIHMAVVEVQETELHMNRKKQKEHKQNANHNRPPTPVRLANTELQRCIHK